MGGVYGCVRVWCVYMCGCVCMYVCVCGHVFVRYRFERRLGVAGAAGGGDGGGAGAPEHDDVEQGVGAEAVGAVHGRAGRLAGRQQPAHHFVRPVLMRYHLKPTYYSITLYLYIQKSRVRLLMIV